jgi:hypothetical protein
MHNKPDECGGGMGSTRSNWVEYIPPFTLLGEQEGEQVIHTWFKVGEGGALLLW